MTLTRRISVVLAGLLALAGLGTLATGTAHAQAFDPMRLGQPRTDRWNEERTGFAFDPANLSGLKASQLPAFIQTQRDPKSGRDYQIPNPDLVWYFPEDVEGVALEDSDGNKYPLGYTLDEIHSSPIIGSLDNATGQPVLSVMFGSTTKVRRDIRNNLPPESFDDVASGRAGAYTTGGVYNSDKDPYAYLHQQNTGAVYALDAINGTRDVTDAGASFQRSYKPL
jgi:hypothetical protein